MDLRDFPINSFDKKNCSDLDEFFFNISEDFRVKKKKKNYCKKCGAKHSTKKKFLECSETYFSLSYIKIEAKMSVIGSD